MYIFNNNVSAYPVNCNVGYNNSWVEVDSNAGRELFAQASYITNLSDINISLSASDVDIGSVHIQDPNTGLKADIVSVGIGSGALRVISQDLESAEDDVTIGDRLGNFAAIYPSLSALKVYNTNPITSVNVSNFPTQLSSVNILNPITSVSILNFPTQLTAVSITNQLTGITILNPVTSVNISNQITGISVTNDVQVHASATFPISGSVTILNPITSVNIINSSFTLSNSSIEISNDIGNPVPVSFTSSISTTPIGTQNVTYADSIYIDESSRLRVATPQTQWWFMATVDKDGDLRYNESFVGGASSIFVQNLASVNMTSNTTSVSGQAIRASRRRHKIIPGLSHEYTGVWNWDGQQANTVKRIGIFTQYNGYFFELSGTNAMNAVVRRRLPDGTLVEERVNQTEWNGDKLDGSGPSAENWNALTQTAAITGWVSTTTVTPQNAIPVYNVVYGLSAGQVQNFRQGTKATITGITPSGHNAVATVAKTDTATNRLTATYLFNPGASVSNINGASMTQTGYHMQHTYWIDFMGGRTNRIRFGKASDYGKIVLHTFRFDGLLGTAYENAPTLTERKEIYNIGTPTSFPSFTVMGNSFNVEAAVDITPNFNVAKNNTGITFDTADEFPILGLALRAGEPYQRADIQLQNLYIMDIANMDNNNNKACFSWRVVLNPSIQGTIPASTNIGKASRQWQYTTANSVSGGIDLIGGYGVSTLTENFPTALNFINMGSNIDNTDSDKIVVVAKLLNKGTTNSSLVATMNFIEAL